MSEAPANILTMAVVSKWQTEAASRLNESLAVILGDKTASVLGKLGLMNVRELLAHTPYRYVSGTETTEFGKLLPGMEVALVAKVVSVDIHDLDSGFRGPSKQRLEAIITDGQHQLALSFFGKPHLIRFWSGQLRKGVKGIFVGKVSQFRDQLQISHPNFVMLDEDGRIVGYATETKRIMADQVARSDWVGIYRATSAFPTWMVAECVSMILDQLGGMGELLPNWALEDGQLPGYLEAVQALHRPVGRDVEALNDSVQAAQRRLKYDEAIALQLTMMNRKLASSALTTSPIRLEPDGLVTDFDAALPFALTSGQQRVSEEIFADLAKPTPMQRLLQGEVGSGKTVVALRAMLATVASGKQAVLLVPTEVLVSQHAQSIGSLLGMLPVQVVALTGSHSAAEKRLARERIASGEAQIIIGTHALLSDGVQFADLGLLVVDEQHRFGVEQRAKLQAEGNPHVLVMTATPIPRSVAMTVFGDLEVSTLAELPAGREEVQTTVVALRRHPAWLGRVWQRIFEEVESGRQVFVVCPRISSSEADYLEPGETPSATVEDVLTLLKRELPSLRIDALHGRMKPAEKDAVMADFVSARLDVLVSTTVIEVGVDVPNASMMVILDADRFGISQLHQLRGRIGRGAFPGLCLLVTNAELDAPSQDRMAAVASTRDGFELANEDLRLRREGNVLGAAQAGAHSTLRLLRAIDDADLIEHAREIAIRWLADSPEDPRLKDLITQTELTAQVDWAERN